MRNNKSAPDRRIHDCRAAAFEAAEDVPTNPNLRDTIGEVIQQRFGRRHVMRGTLAMTVLGTTAGSLASLIAGREAGAVGAHSRFTEIEHGVDEDHHVAPGYQADILVRWGDPVTAGAPTFNPQNQTAEAQAQQFGYNNDFIGFIPLDDSGDRAVLCVNHEYTNEEVMFPGLGRQDKKDFEQMTPELIAIEMAAIGGTIIEIERVDGKWRTKPDSAFNRRITVNTPMTLSGPAAGHPRLKTKADPTGTRVLGTLNDCAGGITPWGTYLMAEENFNGYFSGADSVESHPEAEALKRYGIPRDWYNWGTVDERFDISKEPNEVNRFGWIVEVDPRDPTSTPKKRTALGRFKHEGAGNILNADGRVVVYSGDDQRFDYVYRFVTEGRFDPANRAANIDLLDSGTLSVARFNADGTVVWLPLVQGQGPLTPENGFASQADVVIGARLAADLLGATPMDRPEDIQANPKTGKVYVMLTNNKKRTPEQIDAVNARAENLWGVVLEITPDGKDHTADGGRWDIVVACGDPADPAVQAKWNPATSKNGWFANPDNCVVDPDGALWVSTDQGKGWAEASGTADGVWLLETEGPARGTGRMLYRAPVGAEMCGPCFSNDGETLFVAVQHVAVDGAKDYKPFGRDSTFEDPATRWPDFKDDMPPRPSVVAITKTGGGKIGS